MSTEEKNVIVSFEVVDHLSGSIRDMDKALEDGMITLDQYNKALAKMEKESAEDYKRAIELKKLREKSEKDLAQAEKKRSQEVQKQQKEEEKALKDTTSAYKGMASAIGVMAVAMAGFSFAKESLEDFKNQEQANRLVAFSFGEGAKAITEFSQRMQDLTGVADESTMSYASMLKNMGRTPEEIQKILTASADLEAGSGGMIGMEMAVRNLNKTYSGMAGELGEVLPFIRELSAEEMKAGEAVDEVAKKFKGMAEEMAKTPLGVMLKQQNEIKELREEVGGKFLPIQTQMLRAQLSIIDSMVKMKPVIDAVTASLSGMFSIIANLVDNKVALGLTAVAVGIVGITTAVTLARGPWLAFNTVVKANPLLLWASTAVIAITAINEVVNAITGGYEKVLDIQQKALNADADSKKKLADSMREYTEIKAMMANGDNSQKERLKELEKQMEATTGQIVRYNKETKQGELVTRGFMGAGGGIVTTQKQLTQAYKATETQAKRTADALKDTGGGGGAGSGLSQEELRKLADDKLALQQKIGEEARLLTKSGMERELETVRIEYEAREKEVVRMFGNESSTLKTLQSNRELELQAIRETWAQKEEDRQKKEDEKIRKRAEDRATLLKEMAQDAGLSSQPEKERAIQEVEVEYSNKRDDIVATYGQDTELLAQLETTKQARIREVKEEWRVKELEDLKKFNDQVKAEEDRANEERAERLTTGFDLGIQSINALGSFLEMGSKKNQQRIDKDTKAQIGAISASTKAEHKKAKEIEALNSKANEEKHKMAMADWRMAITMSLINTALGITKTMATMGYPAGIPFAVALGISGAVATAGIISNKPQMEKMSEGGVVGGGSLVSDSKTIQVNAGERIINKGRTRKLDRMIDQGSLGGDTNIQVSAPITVNGDATPENIGLFQEATDAFVDKVVGAFEKATRQNKIDPSRFSLKGAF